MIELANDIIIRCNNCGETVYCQRELYDPVAYCTEKDMGPEYIATIHDEILCPFCRNSISFSLTASLYAYDTHNEHPSITGGSFLEFPYIQFIDEMSEFEFCEWAYVQADENQRLVLDSAHDRNHMYYLESREFERLVEQLFIGKGFITTLTQSTRDGGKDIIAEKNIGTNKPIVIYIECKKYGPRHSVGVPVLRELYGVMTAEKINRGMLVTSSYFSSEVYSLAKDLDYLIELCDGDQLYRMIVTNANDYYASKY